MGLGAWLRQGLALFAVGSAVVVAGGVAAAVMPASASASPQPAPGNERPATGTLYLEGLGATAQPGVSVLFGASLSNDGPGAAAGLRTLINVSIQGVGPRELRVDRRESGGSAWTAIGSVGGDRGDVTFIDDSSANRWMMAGTVLTSRYRLVLPSRAPSDQVVITAEAQHRVGSEWLSLARSPRYVTKLTPAAAKGLGQQPAAPFSPAPTLSATASPVAPVSGQGGGQTSEADPMEPASTAPWLVTSRFGTALSMLVVAGLLAAACWRLHRAVSPA